MKCSVIALTPQESSVIYNAASDVAQVLMHCYKYSDIELATHLRALSKDYARTMYDLAEDKLFHTLPLKLKTRYWK